MKILQINCVYNTGSTGKIVADIHNGLRDAEITSLVFYGRGEAVDAPGVKKVCWDLYAKANKLRSMITGLMYGGCGLSTKRLMGLIRREKPDVVHLHCINGYFVNIYKLIQWLKTNHIKTVLTLHAEFMYTANCGYAQDCGKWLTGCGSCPSRRTATKSLFFDGTARSFLRMQRAFHGFQEDCIIASVSPWLMKRAERSVILKGFRHETVLNGIDARNLFYPRDPGIIRQELNIGSKDMVVHVTPSFSLDPAHIKGGWYVVELAKRLPQTVFVIVGSRDTSLQLPANVINIGRVEDQQELASIYSAADITLLTSRKETFSMVTAESISCATPVLGFRSGAPEEIAVPEYSAFVEYGNMDALEAAMKEWMHKKRCGELPALAQPPYDSGSMVKHYLQLYGQLLGDR